ncbi:MAG: hypothetical protein R3F11_12750 [Verrucomicrobiales bacterium]
MLSDETLRAFRKWAVSTLNPILHKYEAQHTRYFSSIEGWTDESSSTGVIDPIPEDTLAEIEFACRDFLTSRRSISNERHESEAIEDYLCSYIDHCSRSGWCGWNTMKCI